MTSTTPGPSVNYEYDGNGNCTAITTLSAGGAILEKTTYTYDQYKRCTSMVESAHTSQNRVWNWSYDGFFQWPDGSRVHVDATTHTSKQWRQQVEPAYDAAGNRKVTERVFDLNDRIVEEKTGVAPDLQVQHFGYDENGQKNDYIDPRGRETTYVYDLRNRLWKTNETVNTIPRTTEILYDHAGNKTDVFFPVEAGGQRSQHWVNYDAFGQAWTFIDERNNVTDFTYLWGPMKKLYTVTTHRDKDGGGTEDQRTWSGFDLMGRPILVIFPDGSYEESTYQYGGQLLSWKTRKGQLKTIEYDARGRETHHSWTGYNPAPEISRSWDDANRALTLCNVYSTIDYQYDGAGLVWKEGDAVAGSGGRAETTFWRYPDGNVSDVQYPDGISIHRDYTSRGQLKSVTDNLGSQPVIQYTYLADGKVEHADYRNGVHTVYGYDGRGMIGSIQNTRGDGANLSSRTYWRDERDRITAYQKSTSNSVNPMENGRGDRFRYDEEGQLVEAWYNAPNPSSSGDGNSRYDAFNYDALGNRRGANYVQAKGWTQYTRKDNGLNQYTGLSPSFFAQYDEDISGWGAPQQANGVLMEDGNIVAGYNALNQPMLINTQAMGSDWLFLGYDPLGRCVKRWVSLLPNDGTLIPPPESNPATYFYYEGWNLIQEGSSFANPTKNYVHGARVDEIVKQIRLTDMWERYFHYDARGHCTLQTDTGGNIVEQYEYDAFGTPYCFDGGGHDTGYSQWGNRFLFTGREWLSDLKLYDYRNRLYQPELGRFMQPDPKEFGAGDYNLYRYCHNDPVNKSDPFGLAVPPVSDDEIDYVMGEGYSAAQRQQNNDIVKAIVGALRFLPFGDAVAEMRDGNNGAAFVAAGMAAIPGGKAETEGLAAARRIAGPVFQTAKEATTAAVAHGWTIVKGVRSMGQKVFTDGKRFFTRDITGHKGGAWKELNKKFERMQTVNKDLKGVGD
jgi:RHS repeat-associated protein